MLDVVVDRVRPAGASPGAYDTLRTTAASPSSIAANATTTRTTPVAPTAMESTQVGDSERPKPTSATVAPTATTTARPAST